MMITDKMSGNVATVNPGRGFCIAKKILIYSSEDLTMSQYGSIDTDIFIKVP